ncbi:MAG: SOS response-associated peptidase [Bacteroidota bacterium]|nr:SOS response-associated peptidase [Candidatus Kapabacteria bacterium]MDW8219103.1 SOS response-associated peptidase [Bacteroidota bacterium]
MCGRYTMFAKPSDVQQRFRATMSAEVERKLSTPRYNIAPTQEVPIITSREYGRTVEIARWGLIPSWSRDASLAYKLINARAETLHEKPSFKDAFRKRRCLVVANGFYEWKNLSDHTSTLLSHPPPKKQPIYVQLKGGGLFGMAGLWEEWNNPATGDVVTTCTIITTQPNELIATVHHRMAVVLTPEGEDVWLHQHESLESLRNLLKPLPSEVFEMYPVSTRVNAINADDASMIEPIALSELAASAACASSKQRSLFS